jgi:hypothetical protein
MMRYIGLRDAIRLGYCRGIITPSSSIEYQMEERGSKLFIHWKMGGITSSNTENILKHASEFYKQLFGPGMGDKFGIESDMWGMDDMVTQEENIVLVSPFSEVEVHKALFQMEKNKAADPDGIPIEFYQSCWNFIKGDMMALFMEFHEERMDIRRLNYGIITLLLKIKEAARIQ